MSNNDNSTTPKWLRRIFSIEFAALLVAIVGAYFAYVPIKSYFLDEDNIVAVFDDKEFKLSNDKEKSDTIKILAFTYNWQRIPTIDLLTLYNTSNQTIKGLNVKTSYISEYLILFISEGWKYLERGESGSMCYTNNELTPFGTIRFPFEDFNRVNPDEPYHALLTTTSVAYEGSDKEKYISVLINLIDDIDVNDIYNKTYGNGTPAENREGFNNYFINKCVKETLQYYNHSPEKVKHFYVLINTFDRPTLLSMDEVLERAKKHNLN